MSAETPVLLDLVQTHLPAWTTQTHDFLLSKTPTRALSTTTTGETETELVGPIPVKPAYETSLTSTHEALIMSGKSHGQPKLALRPDAARTRFSAMTSPVVWYDGAGQKFLFMLWEAINRSRGDLRKEIMGIRRKFQKERYRPLQAILEATDKHLETATRLTENAAFKMLKGEEYSGHLRCIIRRFKNAGTEIEASGLMYPAPPEEEEPRVPFASHEDIGEGILEADDGDESEGELDIVKFLPATRRAGPGATNWRSPYQRPEERTEAKGGEREGGEPNVVKESTSLTPLLS
ncbi:hypothetical protein BJ508DRAFT_91936 [Ascobolus immersus RN42]|uniref:Uncharacterized protein n=1 Tax=Ascobolus immersus RN42 TaxID=1160509 RepID=A0A3N4HE07_ASCIM|nr:hypothetical protein BJ508DRAFT_91936 [Ascobolus immersus RN42]